MTPADVLADAFGRIREAVHDALHDIDPKALTYRPDPEANSIAWLVWHLARTQDDHIAGVAGTEQQWTAAGWHDRFALPFAVDAIGYGQSAEEVGAVQVSDPALLLGYFDAAADVTAAYLGSLTEADLDRVVDERWDPPVTLAVRLVSVVADNLQHVGQVAYLRGVFERGGPGAAR